MNNTIETRIDEIENLVTFNEINSATKRLLDFVTDYSKDRKRRREAITLRSNYNELRENSRILHEDVSTKMNKIKLHILELIEILLEEHRLTEIKKPDVNMQKSVEIKQQENEISSNNLHDINKTDYELEREKFKTKRDCKSLIKINKEHKSDIIFEGKNITKTYKSKSVAFTLHPMNITMKKGEITALVGENGNGKTTLLKIIGGILKTDIGMVNYPNFNHDSKQNWYDIKSRIAFIPQSLQKWDGVLDKNLHFSAAANGIYGIENDDNVDFIISRLALDKYRNARWNEISGGYKTRFELAKFLVWQPQLLLLDEPLANLDVNTQLQFLQDLRNLANSTSQPISILISSQHLHEVEEIADNIIFLQEGRDIYNGKVKDFGNDRDENAFEIACNLNKDSLLDLLEKLDYLDIEENGNQYIINTPLEVSRADLLKLFVINNVELSFFRDISKSTRKLFKKQSL